MSVFIHGAGTSLFGRQPDCTEHQLAWEAVIEALEDAGAESVDAAYVGTVFGPHGVAQRALHSLGITGVPVVTVENACASGTTAYHEAQAAVASGRYGTALVLGIEHMSSKIHGPIPPVVSDPEGFSGMPFPGLYAMSASRYMAAHGVSAEDMAAVAVKNHRHASANRRAMHGGEYTVAEVLGSRMIADPLTRLQCSSISDGAGALVLGGDRGNPRDVRVRASALQSGGLWDYRSDHAWGFEIVRGVSRSAFELAGVGIGDIDVLEVHDAFTIGEIITTEGLGMAPEGGGARLVTGGHTRLGGRQPVNPSGGLLARGHPIGATGIAQIYEVVTQLRGEAHGRQVEDARLGLVETMGGSVSGIDGNGCVVTILERPGTG